MDEYKQPVYHQAQYTSTAVSSQNTSAPIYYATDVPYLQQPSKQQQQHSPHSAQHHQYTSTAPYIGSGSSSHRKVRFASKRSRLSRSRSASKPSLHDYHLTHNHNINNNNNHHIDHRRDRFVSGIPRSAHSPSPTMQSVSTTKSGPVPLPYDRIERHDGHHAANRSHHSGNHSANNANNHHSANSANTPSMTPNSSMYHQPNTMESGVSGQTTQSSLNLLPSFKYYSNQHSNNSNSTHISSGSNHSNGTSSNSAFSHFTSSDVNGHGPGTGTGPGGPGSSGLGPGTPGSNGRHSNGRHSNGHRSDIRSNSNGHIPGHRAKLKLQRRASRQSQRSNSHHSHSDGGINSMNTSMAVQYHQFDSPISSTMATPPHPQSTFSPNPFQPHSPIQPLPEVEPYFHHHQSSTSTSTYQQIPNDFMVLTADTGSNGLDTVNASNGSNGINGVNINGVNSNETVHTIHADPPIHQKQSSPLPPTHSNRTNLRTVQSDVAHSTHHQIHRPLPRSSTGNINLLELDEATEDIASTSPLTMHTPSLRFGVRHGDLRHGVQPIHPQAHSQGHIQIHNSHPHSPRHRTRHSGSLHSLHSKPKHSAHRRYQPGHRTSNSSNGIHGIHHHQGTHHSTHHGVHHGVQVSTHHGGYPVIRSNSTTLSTMTALHTLPSESKSNTLSSESQNINQHSPQIVATKSLPTKTGSSKQCTLNDFDGDIRAYNTWISCQSTVPTPTIFFYALYPKLCEYFMETVKSTRYPTHNELRPVFIRHGAVGHRYQNDPNMYLSIDRLQFLSLWNWFKCATLVLLELKYLWDHYPSQQNDSDDKAFPNGLGLDLFCQRDKCEANLLQSEQGTFALRLSSRIPGGLVLSYVDQVIADLSHKRECKHVILIRQQDGMYLCNKKTLSLHEIIRNFVKLKSLWTPHRPIPKNKILMF